MGAFIDNELLRTIALANFGTIPFSKPNGKFLYFQKSEIDQWLIKNKSLSENSIKEKTQNYTLKKIEK
ncbi:hypothetical protein HX017_17875 [Myroides marinus]|uniref:hypothetical protein n=1 Tax=Myroides marinus TaxID=703342 RepID=UPI000A7E6304|nr:hypothetical protein [Myroides marinus]MDM1348195.1 hypothetical protein [Myroides marinus]MDM1352051.1 hypothetical protein [Myroides marinus]MDM1359263.1 hypothetical protein [Myroides marinus]MDM1366796.1 hypothetical protein [Myroides marinus]MDM1380296.1 hypothetical protein [Myroides marinus]